MFHSKPYIIFRVITRPIMAIKTGYERVSIAGATRLALESNLPAKIAIYRGYANLSSLARLLKPKVDELASGVSNVESIVTALKRIKGRLAPLEDPDIARVLSKSSVTVKLGVRKFSFERPTGVSSVLLDVLKQAGDHVIHLTGGIRTITVVVEESVSREVREALRLVRVLEDRGGLTAIIISSPPEIIETPGCVLAMYMKLFEAGVNIEDTSSSFTDTIILVKEDYSVRAFEALNELISNYRRILASP